MWLSSYTAALLVILTPCWQISREQTPAIFIFIFFFSLLVAWRYVPSGEFVSLSITFLINLFVYSTIRILFILQIDSFVYFHINSCVYLFDCLWTSICSFICLYIHSLVCLRMYLFTPHHQWYSQFLLKQLSSIVAAKKTEGNVNKQDRKLHIQTTATWDSHMIINYWP